MINQSSSTFSSYCHYFFPMPKQRSRRIRTGNHRRDATRYIQEQYRHCLQRFTHRFRKYARAIARKFNEYRYLIDNDTGTYIHVESTTVQINRFNICGFIDGSVWETFTPGSGPHGDYNGTMRRNDWYVTQRSVYSGYRKLHGLH